MDPFFVTMKWEYAIKLTFLERFWTYYILSNNCEKNLEFSSCSGDKQENDFNISTSIKHLFIQINPSVLFFMFNHSNSTSWDFKYIYILINNIDIQYIKEN